MSKLLSLLFSSLFFFVFFINPVLAQELKQVVLVNPIRGSDFWNYNYPLTETPREQYEIIKRNNFPATWLLRYDALENPEVREFLKSLDPAQDIGIFFEITPSLTNAAGVKYNDTGNWHFAKSVLLTGYSPGDRKKLIDIAFNKFKEVVGRDAKSVGAWWIDAGSLSYMKDKYGIESNLDVADQYSTDGYQVWGQYWSTPFYPSKVNALMPAGSEEMKLDVVTMQWATRDPFNGFGNGVFESTYSVQANDYMLHNLGTDYFGKLLDIYPQTTVGLENDFSWVKFGNEFENQINLMKQKQKENKIQVKNMLQFADYYSRQNPGISPKVVITADDPLGGEGKVVWVNTPKYRIGWFYSQEGSIIRDLRKFNDRNEESCLKVACEELKLAFDSRTVIDDGNYSSAWVLDDGRISEIKVTSLGYGAQISYKNQAGTLRNLNILENDIEFAGSIDTLDGAILKILTSDQNLKPEDPQPFNSQLNTTSFRIIVLNALKFLLFVFLFLLIPGFVFVNSRILAIPVGISIFTLISWILGILGLDLLIWGLPVISSVLLLRFYRRRNWKLKIGKNDLILWSLIVVGSLTWMVTQYKNGLLFNYGLGFWGPNGHDAVWHLSLISELQKHVPPDNPIFAGVSLSNYHYFFDLLVAKSANVLGIDPVELLFRLFPVLISILAGLLIYKVSEKIFKSKTAAFFSTFFLYFGGSFGWVLTYLKDGSFAGETTFWAQQSISTLLNPPFAISVVLFLSGLWIFYDLLQKPRDRWGSLIALILLWGTLIEFKAYAGILVLGAYGLFSLHNIILRRDFSLLLGFLPTLGLSLLVFLPNNTGSETLIEFRPFWLIDSMVSSQDRLNWIRLTLTLDSGVWYKLIYGYGLGILIFLAGNLGTRLISLASLRELFKQPFLLYIIILSITLPLLFVQKGTAWNIVQFFYYGLLILNIFAGVGSYYLFKKLPKFAALPLVLIIVLLTIPTTLGTFRHYLPERPPTKLPIGELEALNFLKSKPWGTVLVLPYDEKLASRVSTPKPLALYTSTAYVSAFSSKPVFMEDTVNLEILGIDNKGRLNTLRDFMKIRQQSGKILRENNISYVYVPSIFNFQVDEGAMGLKSIFENEETKVYKVL